MTNILASKHRGKSCTLLLVKNNTTSLLCKLKEWRSGGETHSEFDGQSVSLNLLAFIKHAWREGASRTEHFTI